MKIDEYSIIIMEWLPETLACLLTHLADNSKQGFRQSCHFWDDFINHLKSGNTIAMDKLIASTNLKLSNRNKNELIIISDLFDVQIKINHILELIIFDKTGRIDLLIKLFCDLYVMFPNDDNLSKLEEAILLYRLKRV